MGKQEKRIILIGGNGFVGSNLAASLTKSGYHNIATLTRSALSDNKTNGVKIVTADFADCDVISKLIRQNDIVVHLACSTIPSTSEADREKDIKENIIGTVRLLEVCAAKKISKFIFLSSGGTVYGDHGKKKLREEYRCDPLNSHGAMKLAIEKYIGTFGKLYGLKYAILRPGNIYGRTPDPKRPQGAVDIFYEHCVQGKLINIWGDGSVVRDYIHINDVVDLLVRVIERDFPSTVINVGLGKGSTLKTVIKIIEKETGKKARVKYTPRRKLDSPYVVLDVQKAKKILGWSPRYDLKHGVRMMHQTKHNNT
jgi:UDP-glucose 4-epimerase